MQTSIDLWTGTHCGSWPRARCSKAGARRLLFICLNRQLILPFIRGLTLQSWAAYELFHVWEIAEGCLVLPWPVRRYLSTGSRQFKLKSTEPVRPARARLCYAMTLGGIHKNGYTAYTLERIHMVRVIWQQSLTLHARSTLFSLFALEFTQSGAHFPHQTQTLCGDSLVKHKRGTN